MVGGISLRALCAGAVGLGFAINGAAAADLMYKARVGTGLPHRWTFTAFSISPSQTTTSLRVVFLSPTRV